MASVKYELHSHTPQRCSTIAGGPVRKLWQKKKGGIRDCGLIGSIVHISSGRDEGGGGIGVLHLDCCECEWDVLYVGVSGMFASGDSWLVTASATV